MPKILSGGRQALSLQLSTQWKGSDICPVRPRPSSRKSPDLVSQSFSKLSCLLKREIGEEVPDAEAQGKEPLCTTPFAATPRTIQWAFA